MNLEAMGMLAITTVIGLITTAFWRWVSIISDSNKDNTKKLDDVKADFNRFRLDVTQNYQSKTDAHKDTALIMDMLKEIKGDVKELSAKIDLKMDK